MLNPLARLSFHGLTRALVPILCLVGIAPTWAQTPVRGKPLPLIRATTTRGTTRLVTPAQAGFTSPEELKALAEQGIVPQGALPSDQDDGAEEKAEPETDRGKKLKKLVFDRRPSAALSAWAAEPPEAPAPPAKAEPVEIPLKEVDTEGMSEEEAAEAREEAAEEQEKAQEAAEKKAEKAAEKAAKEFAEKQLEVELALFQRRVSLGEWDAVREYMASLTTAEGRIAYAQLIKSLTEGPVKVSGTLAAFAEKNYFDAQDLVGLVAAAPAKLVEKQINGLGQLIRLTVDEGVLIESCLNALRPALAAEDFPLAHEQLAHVLLEGHFFVEAGEFLPSLEAAQAADDRPILNLLARHHLAQFQRDKQETDLNAAWQATMSVLAPGELEDDTKEEALKRAVELAPKVHDTLGQTWLTESFTTRPERGVEILSLLGASSSRSLFEQARVMPLRQTNLELQTTAAEALLEAAPKRAREWADTLNLLANNWLQEAACTHSFDTTVSRGQSVKVDPFGNIFYSSTSSTAFNRNAPTPIGANEMLAMRPSSQWMELIAPGLRPKFEMVTAQLLLKVQAEEEAFPYIERLARTHPEQAEALVEEFLRVWIRNNNPNVNNNRTNEYMFVYGFSQLSAGIPLTRSKQERNLKELAAWVQRIRALPLEGVNEELVATAFTNAHSSAEVYQVETIEGVFGALDELAPRTVAALVQEMRKNLVGVWRRPATQEAKKTNRRQKDIEAEILRGYETAASVALSSLDSHPDDWSLRLALASVAHDENNFRQEVAKSSEFAGKRREALSGFAEAARIYQAALPGLAEDEEAQNLYETWFYASLGACDLQALDSYKQPVQNQLALIKDAIEALPGEAATRHMDRFANALFTRVGSVNPAVKYSYLRSGLKIAGETERTREAHKILTYYKDLITEIQLDVAVDGSAHVGSGEPFGVFVNLRHTGAIERESGGFGKYLVNQNSTVNAFNYGRPTEDYRDKFEEFTHDVLSEHFEVQSITFNHPDTHSRATAEYGWRLTPYAYVLMKARGPEVDRIPSLRLDLDFMDSVGYALLPIESAPVVLDCGSGQVDPRPFAQLKLTQTLDEREAESGKLLLEVQASARGLLPAFTDLVDLAPEGFEVVSVEDQGNAISKFDAESAAPQVISDRTFMVEMQAGENLTQLPDSFAFGSTVLAEEEVELTYQRYVDADLASVGQTISLEARYGEVAGPGLWTWLLGTALALALALGVRSALRSAARGPGEARFTVPEPLSPFTVIGLLRRIESTNGLTPDSRVELQGQIQDIEEHFFGEADGTRPDLSEIAQTWVQRST
ncbi:MAG: hypothetical protein QGI93_01310 [Planctomycetota bacterium]|nr:hypothetical protein [Planctomycetota bacterium]